MDNAIRGKGYLSCGFILIIIAFALVFLSCTNSYVGREVDASNWCSCHSFPTYCHFRTDWFIFDFTIVKTDVEDEYKLAGYMSGAEGGAKSFSKIALNESRFRFILANKGVVVDTIAFRPMGDMVNKKLPINVTFKCKEFKALTVSYSVTVRG